MTITWRTADPEITKYYQLGSRPVAMRVDDGHGCTRITLRGLGTPGSLTARSAAAERAIRRWHKAAGSQVSDQGAKLLHLHMKSIMKALGYAAVLCLIILLLCGCKQKSYEDLELVKEFQGHFAEGMSLEAVQAKLEALGCCELFEKVAYDDGRVDLVYTTPSFKEWGAYCYRFRFSSDHRLIVVFSVVP